MGRPEGSRHPPGGAVLGQPSTPERQREHNRLHVSDHGIGSPQAERDAGGSIIQHWRPDEIKQVLIPILPMDVQKELFKQIQQSFKLRKESKRLLEVAKTAVEIAIEQGEAKAMKYIEENS